MDNKELVLNPYQKRISCCYKCEDRKVGCHSICEKYINEQAEKEARLARVRKERALDLIDAERGLNKAGYFRRVGSRK